jgi:hypothetical protein
MMTSLNWMKALETYLESRSLISVSYYSLGILLKRQMIESQESYVLLFLIIQSMENNKEE